MGHDQVDPTRWMRRGIALAAILIGWIFIAWQNRFHFTPATVFACIAYFAAVITVYNLWRTGAAVVANEEDDPDDSTWGKPMGAIGELEREKRTLLKAIKEAEFDQQMGKLSKADADEMIQIYRDRAIEVIKELEKLERGGRLGTKREQIEREVRARLELDKPQQRAEAKADKKKKKGADAAKSSDAKSTDNANSAAKSGATSTDDTSSDTADRAAAKSGADDKSSDAANDAKSDASGNGAAKSAAEAADGAKASDDTSSDDADPATKSGAEGAKASDDTASDTADRPAAKATEIENAPRVASDEITKSKNEVTT